MCLLLQYLHDSRPLINTAHTITIESVFNFFAGLRTIKKPDKI